MNWPLEKKNDFPTWPQDFADRYREAGYWQGETFGEMLANRAFRYSDQTAIVTGEKKWSYRELHEKSEELALGFYQLGIRAKDPVVVQLPNIAEFFSVCFALFRLGALPIFALPAHRKVEISYFCKFTRAKAYIASDIHGGFDYRKLAREVQKNAVCLEHVVIVGEAEEFLSLEGVQERGQKESTERELISGPESSDVAFFQLSGGTTGVPKLIPRTHDDYIYSLRASIENCAVNDRSVYLGVLPIAHNFPLSSPGTLGTLYAGGTVVLALNPSPDCAFPLIAREKVTITAVVPPLALIWLESAKSKRHDLSSLEVLQVGGAKFSEEVARRVKPTLGCQLQQVFGMAEGLVNYTRLDASEKTIVTTQGRPASLMDEIRIVDEEDHEVEEGEVGQLLTRGPYTIRGYYKAIEHNAKSFTDDGFYRTGDLVKMTEEGDLIVEGRVKDQINRGGDKIAAEEVENHLLAHDEVHDVALVAMPDDFLGERSCAFVISREEEVKEELKTAERSKAMELNQFLRDRGLADYKIPDRVEFIVEFPKTALGKVSKKALRNRFAQR